MRARVCIRQQRDNYSLRQLPELHGMGDENWGGTAMTRNQLIPYPENYLKREEER